jgi:hypothetical protein
MFAAKSSVFHASSGLSVIILRTPVNVTEQ